MADLDDIKEGKNFGLRPSAAEHALYAEGLWVAGVGDAVAAGAYL